jgi:hypothetical protein
VGFAHLANRLQQLHHWQYYKHMLIYFSFAACDKAAEQSKRGQLMVGRVGAASTHKAAACIQLASSVCAWG